ncbi:AMP-binding protein [Streptomyces sp. N2-109]|uniref:AMP-binding protein n=1 Tax=Streptomyces gossypii TaxID=2883101 RepID=A0ABT2JLW8_9ACTN|nr:AMP-binding protein [Streptomyces gossypii]MCT2588872.1 AMP-binding protein [Streptomyces gossypii]
MADALSENASTTTYDTRTAHTDTFVLDNMPPLSQQPELGSTLPELDFPTRVNCAGEFVDRWAEQDDAGARLALISPHGIRWTYQDLDEIVSRIAHVLTTDLGLTPGNRVMLRGSNSPMLAAIWLAVIKAGGVVVTTLPLLRPKEITYILDKARIDHVLCERGLSGDLAEALEDRPEGVRPRLMYFHGGPEAGLEAAMAAKPVRFTPVDTARTDPCMIAFTSGTTGSPKASVHTHRDVLAVCNTFPRHVLEVSEQDRFIGSPLLAFTYGLGGLLLFPLYHGASTVLLSEGSPIALARAIADFRATVCFSGPTAYRMVATEAHDCDLSSLRACVSAGEALPTATRELWKQKTGIDLTDGIGATELLHIFISMPGRDAPARPGALGRALPGYTAAVWDEQGRALPPGQVGRLAVRGPTGCRYLADERQHDWVKDGWNLTGDSGSLDEDGYFYYRARTDDMIVSAGYNISPAEVEDALLSHPAVLECAAVGVPDSRRGSIVKAFVVLAGNRAPGPQLVEELQNFTKQTIAPHKYPRAMEFCSELPRGGTGKLQRFRLREADEAARKAVSQDAR